jgi:hypothetical protein
MTFNYPDFSDVEYKIIEEIILECVFEFPDEVKLMNGFICLCAGCSIYDSIEGCDDKIYKEVVFRNEVLLKRCEVVLELMNVV